MIKLFLFLAAVFYCFIASLSILDLYARVYRRVVGLYTILSCKELRELKTATGNQSRNNIYTEVDLSKTIEYRNIGSRNPQVERHYSRHVRT